MADLNRDDVLEEVRDKLFVQDYSSKTLIDGIKIVELKNFIGLDGDLCEVVRISEDGKVEGFPDIMIRQINRSKMIPNTTKAWHLHFKQDEIWYVPPAHRLMLGLWDVRKDSPTHGLTLKVPMGGGISKAVFIPRGVAHGAANFSQNDAEVYYFISNLFDFKTPDEQRFPWDAAGADFWTLPKE